MLNEQNKMQYKFVWVVEIPLFEEISNMLERAYCE